MTQAYNSKLWGEMGSKLVDCGNLTGLTGLEVNFWMLPASNNKNENVTTLFKFLSFIEVAFQQYQTPTN